MAEKICHYYGDYPTLPQNRRIMTMNREIVNRFKFRVRRQRRRPNRCNRNVSHLFIMRLNNSNTRKPRARVHIEAAKHVKPTKDARLAVVALHFLRPPPRTHAMPHDCTHLHTTTHAHFTHIKRVLCV